MNEIQVGIKSELTSHNHKTLYKTSARAKTNCPEQVKEPPDT